MKKTALTALLALGLAEISASTPASAQGIDTFTGRYIGAHAGYVAGNADFTSAPYSATGPTGGPFPIPGRNDSFDSDGLLAGVHGGINYLLGTKLIGGAEADWTWLGKDDSVSGSGTGVAGDGFAFQYRSNLEFEWQSTLRGRLGFVTGNRLFFATAGVAFLAVDWSETATVENTGSGASRTLTHSDSDILVGGAVGGGIEIALSPKMVFGADYLYEFFENFTVPHGSEPGLTGKIDDIDIHKVRVRISIKLGGPPQ